jgi:hypothetical protein
VAQYFTETPTRTVGSDYGSAVTVAWLATLLEIRMKRNRIALAYGSRNQSTVGLHVLITPDHFEQDKARQTKLPFWRTAVERAQFWHPVRWLECRFDKALVIVARLLPLTVTMPITSVLNQVLVSVLVSVLVPVSVSVSVLVSVSVSVSLVSVSPVSVSVAV